MAEPLVAFTLVIPGKPVSINGGYIRAAFSERRGKRGGKGLILSKEGRRFKRRVRDAALHARAELGNEWPANLFAVKDVRLTIRMYDCGFDVCASDKFVRDAFEGVLYVNDKRVRMGPSDPPICDGTGTRIEVDVDLLAIHPRSVAEELRFESEKRVLARFKKRIRSTLLANAQVEMPRKENTA